MNNAEVSSLKVEHYSFGIYNCKYKTWLKIVQTTERKNTHTLILVLQIRVYIRFFLSLNIFFYKKATQQSVGEPNSFIKHKGKYLLLTLKFKSNIKQESIT